VSTATGCRCVEFQRVPRPNGTGLAPLSPLRQRSVGMPEFFDLLREEADPAVRVVLGHFIFVYIHP
jgi:Fic family protein